MLLLKLGGSVITDKNRLNVVRKRILNRLSKEISMVDDKIIIVHGAGSFGHILAERYRLNDGYSNENQLEGFALTHRNVRILNNIVLDSLTSAGIPSISIPPISFIELDNRKPKQVNLKTFRKTLDGNFIPVTFGDVVFDVSLHFSICSGDLLMILLAKEFKPDRVVFAIDEDGIYSKNPKKYKNARLLTELSRDELSKVATDLTYSDVTGGMEGKLNSIAEIAGMGIDVVVVNGNKRDRVYRALTGRRTKGTIIYGEVA